MLHIPVWIFFEIILGSKAVTVMKCEYTVHTRAVCNFKMSSTSYGAEANTFVPQSTTLVFYFLSTSTFITKECSILRVSYIIYELTWSERAQRNALVSSSDKSNAFL